MVKKSATMRTKAQQFVASNLLSLNEIIEELNTSPQKATKGQSLDESQIVKGPGEILK